ncbi:hypothetical protein BB559_004678 [Furculomyces boomerangus]|uniref:Uncharacterized protein n=1 Tax=Furculomyces boomerangus TaxID=61424 RepID=A0A2T9YDG7_9FUNG|nr:hypothetical protein BB559_004678 [Furculomyces boomerangus]
MGEHENKLFIITKKRIYEDSVVLFRCALAEKNFVSKEGVQFSIDKKMTCLEGKNTETNNEKNNVEKVIDPSKPFFSGGYDPSTKSRFNPFKGLHLATFRGHHQVLSVVYEMTDSPLTEELMNATKNKDFFKESTYIKLDEKYDMITEKLFAAMSKFHEPGMKSIESYIESWKNGNQKLYLNRFYQGLMDGDAIKIAKKTLDSISKRLSDKDDSDL